MQGFSYFFQTPAPPRTLKVVLATSRFASPQQAARFSAHCNTALTDTQFCIMPDNFPSHKRAIHLNTTQVLFLQCMSMSSILLQAFFLDTPIDSKLLRKGEALLPFVEGEAESILGKVIIIGFRVGISTVIASIPPAKASKFVPSKPSKLQTLAIFSYLLSFTALIFTKYLSFEVLEKTTFTELIQTHAGGTKHLFILDAPQTQSGVWNDILFFPHSLATIFLYRS